MARAGEIRLDHLGVAVKDPKARLKFWTDSIGLRLDKVEVVKSEGVRAWFLELGEGAIELLEPSGEGSTIAKFLEQRGEGLHHICLRVERLDAVLARLEAQGVRPIGGGARAGAGGARVAFLHPRDAGGVLLELAEHPSEDVAAVAERESFAPGAFTLLHLREPRERVYGVLRRLDLIGVAIEGLDLDSWEDWVSQWARGASGPLSPSLEFFPLARVERLTADRDAPELPSFRRRFEERTGRSLAAAFGPPASEACP